MFVQSTPVGDVQRSSPLGGAPPPVLVSPPMGWPHPPTNPSAGSYYTSPASTPGAEVDSLKLQKDELASQLQTKSQEVERLNAELSTIKGQVSLSDIFFSLTNE